MKTTLTIAFVILITAGCTHDQPVGSDAVTPEMLVEGFTNPPDSVKPWVYWYWISDNNTREGVTCDLEAMAEVGIGEALIGNIGYEGMPYGNPGILSEEWWQLIEHTIREGKRTGVNIGLFNCPGWSQSGGPWVQPEESMRYLLCSETEVEGGRRIQKTLTRPSGPYQQIKVLAFPLPDDDRSILCNANTSITTSPDLDNVINLIDGDTATVCMFRKAGNASSIIIDLESREPFTARSLSLYPADIPFAADIEIQIFENGIFRIVRKFRYDRSNARTNVGPMPEGPVTVSFPDVSATKFRLLMNNFSLSNYLTTLPDNASDAGLSEIILSGAPRVENFIEKQLGKMCQTPFPLWNEYQWKLQEETGSDGMKINPGNVLDLTSVTSADGILDWAAPEGRWIILQIGAEPTGTRNAQAAPHAMGWEVDKMNKHHLRKHFDAYIGKLLERMPAGERTALKHVVLDSYGQGSQNWTENMIEDFAARYGYDPVPWFPVFTGRVVGSADQSDRFLWDWRRLVADRIAYNYVGGFRELCQEKGLRIWLENYGHWGFPSEFLMYGGQSHDVAGEFWNEGDLGNIECRAASSAAHIYGKKLVSAESYTSAGQAYQRYPAMLKKRGDWSYTEGINQVILHLYIHQPYEDKSPGINAWFGTEFNRKNTWFRQSKNWIDYQRRCMFMLRRGLPVNDICYFIGEDVPKMTGARIPEIPVGYSYDYINAEVIMNRLSVKDGRLVLPDGMSYGLMVLPPLETMRPELLQKIAELVEKGAMVYGPPPSRSPSLQNYPEADREVKNLVQKLWNGSDGKTGKSGKRSVMNDLSLKEALDITGVLPDVRVPENIPVLWIHRKTRDCDIYFVANQSDNKVAFDGSFRVSGMQPELWDPLNGMIRDLKAFTYNKGMTEIPLQLEPYGSAFIVFRRSTGSRSEKQEVATNFPDPVTLVQISNPWEVTFDKTLRGPENSILMENPEDWTKSRDERIRFYSGSAVYRNSFTLGEIPEGENIIIDLGKVSVMAEVRVNGRFAGGAWTSPWTTDITEMVKQGENLLEIEVVNNW
ncbi:MAG: glycoside hydrolase family 2 [Bacteroidales bacterium]|nr:glycoside hydrolase family 2 [Bacteroidales bacterium]